MYWILVRLLVIFKPTVFFKKLNQLNWYKNTLQIWVCDLNFTKGFKILEVGSATGVLTNYLKQLKLNPIGVDYSSSMVTSAKKEYKDIDFYVANALNLPFSDNSFDAVISASLINIVDKKQQVITELLRVCKVGGTIAILVPLKGFDSSDLSLLQQQLQVSKFSAAALNAWHNLAPKMSKIEIINLLKSNNLKDIIANEYLDRMVIAVAGIKH